MVNPQSAIVLPRGEQVFEVEGQPQLVEWSLNPPLGRISPVPGSPGKGLYQAPLFRWSSADVKVTAKITDGVNAGGEAVITLSATPNWLILLSIFWVLVFGSLIGGIFVIWPPPPSPIAVEVYPPAVTLSGGKAQQFEARILGSPVQTVTWMSTAGSITPTGLFTAPVGVTNGTTIAITATRVADGKQSAVAQVTLEAEPLVMSKSVVVADQMAAGTNLQFEAHGGDGKPATGLLWMATGGRIDARTGVLTLPDKTATGRVVVSAIDQKNANRKASAMVLLKGGCLVSSCQNESDQQGLWIAFLMGGLGALLGGVRSFAGYAGNRTFVSSWGIFYLSRPVFGSGLALIVYLGFRIGAFKGPDGSAPMDPATAAFVGGFVGLFADDVLGKLKDFVERFLQMSEPRADKMNQDAGTTTAVAPAPSINSVTASKGAGTIVVIGLNYTAASKVQVDGVAATTTFVSATSLSAPLDAAKNVGEDLKVVVVNSPTSRSAEKTVKVVA